MIGLDTNILVRYIVRDDPDQTALATELIESKCTEAEPGFVCQLVLAELFWVLSRGYGYSKPVLVEALTRLLAAVEMDIEGISEAWTALRMYESGSADFADYLIGCRGRSAGCSATFTFDRRASGSPLFQIVE